MSIKLLSNRSRYKLKMWLVFVCFNANSEKMRANNCVEALIYWKSNVLGHMHLQALQFFTELLVKVYKLSEKEKCLWLLVAWLVWYTPALCELNTCWRQKDLIYENTKRQNQFSIYHLEEWWLFPYFFNHFCTLIIIAIYLYQLVCL